MSIERINKDYLLNPESACKISSTKSSAAYYLLTLLTSVSVEENSVDPDQTAVI